MKTNPGRPRRGALARFIDHVWLHLQYNAVLLLYTDEGLTDWLVKNRICMTVTGFRGESLQINPPPLDLDA
jgi:hypothetical protein